MSFGLTFNRNAAGGPATPVLVPQPPSSASVLTNHVINAMGSQPQAQPQMQGQTQQGFQTGTVNSTAVQAGPSNQPPSLNPQTGEQFSQMLGLDRFFRGSRFSIQGGHDSRSPQMSPM